MIVKILFCYFVCINIVGFASMGLDKKKAIKGAWRIPEKTLFLIAFLGGALGSTIGMNHFRHKTKHWYFKFGMPTIFLVQLLVFTFVCYDRIRL